MFAPAALFGKEAELYKMARSRLAPAIQMDGHLFLPTSFLGEMVPEKKNLAEAIRMVTRSVAGMSLDGEDVVQSDPDTAHVVRALESLEFLVVQELFETETARHAHVVLPAAGYLEQEGTFTNGERRIQHLRPALSPPGDARPDWAAVRDVARALGADWRYAGPSDVMDEIAAAAPRLFGGVSYAHMPSSGIVAWNRAAPIRNPRGR